MAENKDEILANFQACTGIDDAGVALNHLEETDWDLMRAVNRAMPENAPKTNDSSPDIEMLEEIPNSLSNSNTFSAPNIVFDEDEDVICESHLPSLRSHVNNRRMDMPSLPSTSHHTSHKILIIFVDHNGRSLRFEMSPSATVSDLKRCIQSETGIQVCRQAITGWKKHPKSNFVALSSLNMSPETRLTVRDTSSDGHMGDNVAARLSMQYELVITEVESGKVHTLPYPGDKTILDVKTDVSSVTLIPVRFQDWTGWPASDSEMLGLAGLDHPSHALTLRSKQREEEAKKPKRNVSKAMRIEDSDESSVEEFEDCEETLTGDDDGFVMEPRSRRQPLIPDKVDDETVGCIHFADEFSSRYGPLHPDFFPGTLDDAIKEACMKPAKERRLLALYLHHDDSVLSNVFCTQILCCDSVVQILAAYFVLWGWDLTFSHNEHKFLNSFTSGLGAMAAMQIKSTLTHVDRLPVIVIISRARSAIEITSVIPGNVGASEMINNLTEIVELFLNQQNVEMKEEDERSAREMIMMQQDQAYQDSLEKDKAKAIARLEQERIESQEKARERKLRAEEEATIECERKEAESRLPSEPPLDSNNITKIRVRLPGGQFLERRFREVDMLQALIDWLHTEGFRSNKYKFLSSWPRRDLTAADAKLSLKQLSLCPQETLILEER